MVSDRTLAELIRSAVAGDAPAQVELVAAYTPAARSAAARLINEPDLVDDVVQDAFIEIFETLDRLREPQAFGAWVRLAVRKHADRHRRRTRPTETLDRIAEPCGPSADELVQQLDLVVGIHAVLASARSADRRLLELRYLADWTVDELADALGITPGAVRKRLHDARRRLRPALTTLTGRQDSSMTNYTALLGHVYEPGHLQIESDVATVARTPERTPITTGLKILDAVTPIVRGGTLEIVGPVGTGHLVLVVELGTRMRRAERASAIVAVASSRQSFGAWSNLSKLVTDLADHERHAVIQTRSATTSNRRWWWPRNTPANRRPGWTSTTLNETCATSSTGDEALSTVLSLD